MRTIPPTLAGRLATGGTQIAHAWIVRRADGAALGFTDHDSDLTIEGIVCRAATGLDAKDMTSELGLAAGGGEVIGVLQAAALREDDIAAGAYDGAEIRAYLCDCEPPFETVLLDIAIIGEVKRDETAFVAELRGPAHRLAEETGRLYQQRCDADFGDSQCRMDLNRPDLSVRASIGEILLPGRFIVSGFKKSGFDNLSHGTLRFDKWPGRNFGIRQHSKRGGAEIIELWLSPDNVQPGDRITAIVGCDKAFQTCASRFGNAHNFRGFPHMPGNEIVLTIVQDGSPGYDGRSLFRG